MYEIYVPMPHLLIHQTGYGTYTVGETEIDAVYHNEWQKDLTGKSGTVNIDITNDNMGKLVINSYDDFAAYLGEELGASEWLQVDQDRINLFADATLDHQWIHVDTERAKEESQYKSTIAHGYLTLSLLPYMWNQIIEVNNIKMLVNYGMDKMRFGQPVITGSRIRLVTKLHNIQNLRGICKAEIDFKIEIEGQRKPALEGIASFLYYFI